MHNEQNLCSHLNEITDHVGGAIICTDCGLVLSNVYLFDFDFEKENEVSENSQRSYILEILARLEMPDCFAKIIQKNLQTIDSKHRKNENAIAYIIYKSLVDLNCGISIKDISAVTGYTDSQIYNFQSCNDCIIVDPITQLEKFCILLELPKDSYSVIKENIVIHQTGHNPTTVLGAAIYNHCKKIKLNLSMQKIAKTLNISSISIQRYLKIKHA